MVQTIKLTCPNCKSEFIALLPAVPGDIEVCTTCGCIVYYTEQTIRIVSKVDLLKLKNRDLPKYIKVIMASFLAGVRHQEDTGKDSH
jgi:hypothetical protein